MDQFCIRPNCTFTFRGCPPCRGRKVVEQLFGGNVRKAPGHYPIDFDAKRAFDRELVAPALVKEFGLLVDVEETPGTLEDLDAFCLKIVSEPKKRNPARGYIYVGQGKGEI